jgi:hypothetical protein
MRWNSLHAGVRQAKLLAEQGQRVLQADGGGDAAGGREHGDPGQGEGMEYRGTGAAGPAWRPLEPGTAGARHDRILLGASILDHAAGYEKSLQERDMEARREIRKKRWPTAKGHDPALPRPKRLGPDLAAELEDEGLARKSP